jgi:simple sugar transport system permease protein
MNVFKSLTKRYMVIMPVLLVLVVAQVETYSQLTTSGTFGAAVRLAIPILLAGLGGLYSEKTGIVNIGLEGMMIMGTWFGAWGGYTFGAWQGVFIGMLGGALFGLIHAIATVSFQVDHIVSGVAINILAAGVARFLNVIAYDGVPYASSTASPRIQGDIGIFTMPFLAGGKIGESDTFNLLGSLENLDLFLVSDFAGLLLGFVSNVSYLTLFALALVPISVLVLWYTPLGLQMRSVGEYPAGSESLGVNVYLMKYIGVTISGALSGLAGSYLVVAGTGTYLEGQTGGRGFIGLASMLFGNYKPFGVLMGSGLFGFADALQLRSPKAVHGLLIIVAIFLLILSIKTFFEKKYKVSTVSLLLSAAFLIWFMNSTTIPNQFVYFTPHITTLIVLSFANQRIKLPEKIGVPYKRGELN